MVKTLAFSICCLMAASAAAQTGGFVQGGYVREVKRFSHDADRSAFDAAADGFSIGAAAFVAPRWSLGVELDLGGASTVSDTISVAISGRPVQITTDYTSRRRSVSALAGFHTGRPGDRLRVGCYAGIGFTAFRREIASDAPAIVLQDPAPLSVLNERVTGPVLGLDLAIRAGARFAIVPGFRAEGLSLSGDLTGFSLRPSVSGRLLF